MNNEPVAWIDPKELDMAVSTSVTKNKQFESDIPLYTHPVKELTDEEIMGLGENTLPNEAIGFVPMWQWIDFARAILRKAQEK